MSHNSPTPTPTPEAVPGPSGPPQTHTAPRTPTALGGRILAALSRMDGTATGLTETRDRILAELDALETRAEQAEALLRELVFDDDPCDYDHHGYCQAHNLQDAPCPHTRAKELLAALDHPEETDRA